VLRVDPTRYLYGQIQRWPLQAQNGETLIVRREGDEVMFLSELRYHPGSGLTLRMPVTTPGLSAAQAVQGEIGTFEGTNYHGMPVFSVLRPIYGTPWYMIAEIDREEALAPTRHVQLVSATITLVAIMLAGLMVGLGWRQQVRNFALRQRMHETERQALTKHFEYLSRNVNDIHLLTDDDFKITEVNERATEITGYSRNDIIGSPLIKFRSVAARATAERDYAKIRNEEHARYESEIQLRDGRQLPVEVSAARVEVKGRNYYQFVIRDISERKRYDEQLRQSESTLRLFFDLSFIGMAITSAKTKRCLQVNQTMCNMLGYPREELLERNWAELTHPDDLPVDTAQFERVLRHEIDGYTMDKRFIRKDGQTVYVAIDVKCVRDTAGEADFFVATVADITERKHTEERLAAAAAQFQGLVEQSIAGIFIIVDGRFAYVNPRLAEILGGDPADLIGHNAIEYVVKSDQALVRASLERCSSGENESQLIAFLGRRRNGSTVDMGAHINRAKHGGQPAVIGVVQDISDKKHAEAKIQDYIQKLERGMLGTIKAVSVMSELRDPYTYGHEQRVGDLSGAIAAEMGLDAQVVKGLQIAGYVHDIGKIVVPAEILAKPTKLTKAEFELIKSHPEQGYEVLKEIDFPWPVAQVALQHHERLDGSGYPQGLKGDQILLEARILAVADVVEAMAAHRPYRASLGIDAALEEVRKYRGVKYDSAAVDACVRLFHERSYALKTVL
jgi:PAS domain S-box-containing protein/putative nucleotidyltransferase with HDIG domain